MRKLLSCIAAALALIGSVIFVGTPAASGVATAPAPVPCATSGTWTPGEVTLYWLNVGQGDSQLIVGPTGKTLLIDIGETAFNTTGASSNASRLAGTIRAICGVGANPVALDYVMASHHHLDHIGYAGNPDDVRTRYGNGLYQLLTPEGLGFSVGTLIDHDGGTWVDTAGDGSCHVGTSANPADNFEWHNAGTTSQTARRWICWLYGPAGQPDRALIEGRVLTVTNDLPWPSLDLGPGVTASIVNANGKDTLQADGITPVSGDNTLQGGSGPPSENDYSIAVLIRFGRWRYATAGDSDGEYNVSPFGYTYNDIESTLAPLFGPVDTLRANHHGSGHSSSDAFVGTLRPGTAFISCGRNDFGHPSNRMLDTLRTVPTDAGIGADIYLANNPCDPIQADRVTPTDYSGTFNTGGDTVLRTTGGGSGYTITYDTGTRVYTAYGSPSTPAAVRPPATSQRTTVPLTTTTTARTRATPATSPARPARKDPVTPLWDADGH
jgi:beta-lactamase superfamily II metal-dependent hydrolase